ncbi:unnamed protein product [Paramecium pentaurelia]|uniref:C2H2-type domain-containing protein n=1 Tax=Paramecium pentaurelia TaxID=43138 RepID=A0A8S1UJZ5_9CILI|nr:unnamed protein product [Paramecium pentaurelia]
MNYSHLVKKRRSKGKSSFQISNQIFIQGEEQNKTVQNDEMGENVFVYLNLSDSSQEREYSYDLDQDLHTVKTKKNNFIIKKKKFLSQQFKCGQCKKVFQKSQSLGGHTQKKHRVEKNQLARLSSIRRIILRERPAKNRQQGI